MNMTMTMTDYSSLKLPLLFDDLVYVDSKVIGKKKVRNNKSSYPCKEDYVNYNWVTLACQGRFILKQKQSQMHSFYNN